MIKTKLKATNIFLRVSHNILQNLFSAKRSIIACFDLLQRSSKFASFCITRFHLFLYVFGLLLLHRRLRVKIIGKIFMSLVDFMRISPHECNGGTIASSIT